MTTATTPTDQPQVPAAPPQNGQSQPPLQQQLATVPTAAPAGGLNNQIPPQPGGPLGAGQVTVPPAPPIAAPAGQQIAVPPPQPIPQHEPGDGDDTDPLPARSRRARPIDRNDPQVKKIIRQELDKQLAEITTQQDRAKLEETERLKIELAEATAKRKEHEAQVTASTQRYELLQAIMSSGYQIQPNAAQFVEQKVSAKIESEGLPLPEALNAVLAENQYVLIPAGQVPAQQAQAAQAAAQVPGQQAPQPQVAPGQMVAPGQPQPAPGYQAPAPAQPAQYPQAYAAQGAAAGMQAQTVPGAPQTVQVMPLVSTTPQVAPGTTSPVPPGPPQQVDVRKMTPQEFQAYKSKQYGVSG